VNWSETARHVTTRVTINLDGAPDIVWAGGITVRPEQAHIQYSGDTPKVVFVTGHQTAGAGVKSGGSMSNCWPIPDAPDWVQQIVAEVTGG